MIHECIGGVLDHVRLVTLRTRSTVAKAFQLWDQVHRIIPYPTGRFFRGTLPRHLAPAYEHAGSLVAFTIIGNCSTDRGMPINLPKIVPPPQADRWLAYFLRTKLRVPRGNFRGRSGGHHE